MPSKRKKVDRTPQRRVTPAVVEAFKAGEYLVLHRLLGLRPWERSPLPAEQYSLGVTLTEEVPNGDQYSIRKAQELRRAIEEQINAEQ